MKIVVVTLDDRDSHAVISALRKKGALVEEFGTPASLTILSETQGFKIEEPIVDAWKVPASGLLISNNEKIETYLSDSGRSADFTQALIDREYCYALQRELLLCRSQLAQAERVADERAELLREAAQSLKEGFEAEHDMEPEYSLYDKALVARMEANITDTDRASGHCQYTSLPRFPTMLRKMWGSDEVQEWLNERVAPVAKTVGAKRAVLGAALPHSIDIPSFPVGGIWSGGEVQRWIDEQIAPLFKQVSIVPELAAITPYGYVLHPHGEVEHGVFHHADAFEHEPAPDQYRGVMTLIDRQDVAGVFVEARDLRAENTALREVVKQFKA